MSVHARTYREVVSCLRGIIAQGQLYKECWQEGTLGYGGGIGKGPHYRRPDCYGIVSPSDEELYVLFFLARMLSPKTIIEYGTGTGVSTAFLALGAPHATVYTADLYSSEYEKGADLSLTCKELWRQMEIPNIQPFIADWEVLPQLAEEKGLHPELIFGDGGINLPRFADFPGAVPQTVYALHDFSASDQRKSPAWNQWMVLNTSCFLGITSRDSKIFPPLYNIVSLLISPERINMERYRGKNDREEAIVETSYGDLKLRY